MQQGLQIAKVKVKDFTEGETPLFITNRRKNMEYEKIYKQEVIIFNNIVKRYSTLQENDIEAAYKLMIDALQCYNRWSKIKCDIKKDFGRGQLSATKARLEEMCRYLKEVHTTSRMIWARAKDDLKSCTEGF